MPDPSNAGKPEGEADEPHLVSVYLPNAPLASVLVVPKGFTVTYAGVFEYKKVEKGFIPIMICPHPVLVVGQHYDIADKSMLLDVVWSQDGFATAHTRTIAREVLADARAIVQEARFGLPVNSGNAAALVKYLAAFEALNRNRYPTMRISRVMGWQGTSGADGFLWGKTLIKGGAPSSDDVRLHIDVDNGAADVVKAMHSKGTAMLWLAAVTSVMGFPRVAMAVFASAASLILPLLPTAANAILDWAGPTSRGKTTALTVAGSFWGLPSLKGGLIYTWDASRSNVERVAAVLGTIPLLLDDTKRARDPKEVAAFVYDFAAGQGRGRATVKGLAKTTTWRSILLSTGESPLTSFGEDGGARARVIEIVGVPFERVDAHTSALAVAVRTALLDNYGHAGPHLAAWLQQEGRLAMVESLYATWRAHWLDLAQGHPVASRMADYFATLSVGAVMCVEAFGLPATQAEAYAILRRIWDETVPNMQDADPPKRALEQVFSWATARQQSFWGRERRDHKGIVTPPSGGWVGAWVNVEGWDRLAILPTALADVLRDLGHEPEGIIAAWMERRWLVHDTGRRNTKVRVCTANQRCIVITRAAFDSIEGGTQVAAPVDFAGFPAVPNETEWAGNEDLDYDPDFS